MSRPAQRHPELTRLYTAAGLTVLIFTIFRVYKLVSTQVESGLDASSRWALLAVGLANALAIGTLLFIIIRSLAKLYFERRRGILGARIRTRLVLAIFAVGIAPSLMLFLSGRNFISKNVDRWFRPETQEIIQDGRNTGEALRVQLQHRLKAGLLHLGQSPLAPLESLREEAALDLVVRRKGGKAEFSLATGLEAPVLPEEFAGEGLVESAGGVWFLQTSPEAPELLGGVLLPKDLAEGVVRLDKRYRESLQIRSNREALETLPQNTFLFLTLMTLFAAVWVGLAISRTIAEPVRALAKAAQRVGMGDLEVALPEQGEDELALLCRSFNTMTQDLRANREAIEAQSERIERQRAYLGQLLEALPVGVLSWQKDGTLRTCNPAARGWLGLEGWDPILQPWEQLAHEPRLGALPALVEEVRRGGMPRQEELRIGGEGEGRPIRAMVLPLAGGGELAVLEDLSLLAEAEKRAAWQEVARRMAHEVKNPLTPIQLTAQRLLRRSREGRLDPTVVREGAETILTEVSSLARLVDSFSKFAKLPAHQPRNVEATELVRQVMALYEPNHPQVTWRLDVPPPPVPVRWDPDMVKRALINLVDNALAVGPATLKLGLHAVDDRALLSVEDDGPGVPEDVRPKLFEPYFSTKSRGTGLGLAIVRRIAQDHGGEASYEPKARGSRFMLELPLGTTPAPPTGEGV